MKNFWLIIIIVILGIISSIGCIIYFIFLFINKEKFLNKIVLKYIFIGLISCVMYGLMHNFFVNPHYLTSLLNLDFTEPGFVSFLIVWAWRAAFYILVFSFLFRYMLIKTKKQKKRTGFFKIMIIHMSLISTAWLTDFEKLFIHENSHLDIYHMLHWVGGIIGPAMMVLLGYIYLEKEIIKFLNIKENFQKIRNKLLATYLGIIILLILSIFGILIGSLNVENSNIILFKLAFFSLLFLIPLTILTFKLTKSYSANLDQAANFLKYASEQDYTKEIQIKSRDEFGALSRSLHLLKENLVNVINTVKKSSYKVDDSANEINIALIDFTNKIENFYNQLKDSIDSQIITSINAVEKINDMTDKINNIVSNINNQSQLVKDNSDSINQISKTTKEITEKTKEASQISNNLFETTQDGKNILDKTLESFKEIEIHSNQIVEINKIIDDISIKTKMLAINAAIEASHAGEVGNSFAIVAQEMKKLSDDTGKNAKKTEILINDILNKIKNSFNLIKESKTQFNIINEKVTDTKKINNDIFSAMKNENDILELILNKTENLVTITNEISNFSLNLKDSNNQIYNVFDEMKVILHKESDISVNDSSFILENIDKIKILLKSNINTADHLKSLINQFKINEKLDK